MSADTGAPSFATVDEAAAAIAGGELVLVVDGVDRVIEGALAMAAERVTRAAVNFMATHGRGLICVPMPRERLDELRIPPMVSRPTDPRGMALHVGVDHVSSSTGISASDRAATIAALADPAAAAADFTQPGHVFPLAYPEGGVLKRAGHAEAAVDLVRIAGLRPAAVICEVAGPSGEIARVPTLRQMARDHGLKLVTIDQVIAYRRRKEQLVEAVGEATLPLATARFRAIGYRDLVTGAEHLALVLGDVAAGPPVLVRVHSGCLAGDVFRSRRCDCGRQLELAVRKIAEEGRGAVVYLRGREGRGIGLVEARHAHPPSKPDASADDRHLGHIVDRRDYGTGMEILEQLGIREMRLLTNNPAKRAGLEGYGLRVVGRVPLETAPPPDNVRSLEARRARTGRLPEAGAGAGPAAGQACSDGGGPS